MTYVELHAHSAYSFLDGASQPEELAVRAAELGYEAFALTDHDGVYGSLEFALLAKELGVRPLTGAEVTLEGGSHVTLLVESTRGYANLCRLLTEAHAGTREKPTDPTPAALPLESLLEHNEGLVCLSGCARHGLAVHYPNDAARVARAFGRERFYVELQHPYERGDARRNARLRELADTLGVHVVATGDPHAHHPRRLRLQDVLVAVRCRTSLDGCERERRGNHESVLLGPQEMAERFPGDPDAVARTAELAERLQFDLTEELGYRYPDFSDGAEPASVQHRRVCDRAFAERYPDRASNRLQLARLEEELALIDELGLAGFFLLHWEVLELAREVAYEVRGPGSMRHVLPPGRGRGASVGSLVCYLTGLSHVDPVANDLSLGRFLNRELGRARDRIAVFGEAIRHFLRRHEHRLVVAAPLALAAVERAAVLDRDEHVLQRGAARIVRVHVAGRDRLHAQRLREIAELGIAARVAALVRPLQLDVEAVAAERARELGGEVRIVDADAGARAAGEADEPFVVLDEQLRVERRRQRVACGVVARVRMRGREQAAEVGVALRVFDEERDVRSSLERHLRAGERADAEVLRGVREFERAVDAVVVGQRERRVAELRCPGRELLRLRCSVQEGVGAMGMELDVHRTYVRIPRR